LVRNRADADELVQETFLRATKSYGQLRDEAAVSTWIYRIATNTCLDFFRRRSARVGAPPGDACSCAPLPRREQREDLVEDVSEGCGLTPEALFETSEMGECVREYIDALPDAFRAALVLHDLEDFTAPEVARILGWSVEKVKINIHRARRRLREIFERECSFYRDGQDTLQWYCKERDPDDHDDGSCQ
jgi:RNA polymerase sigma-70 factor (ECF subfamily)